MIWNLIDYQSIRIHRTYSSFSLAANVMCVNTTKTEWRTNEFMITIQIIEISFTLENSWKCLCLIRFFFIWQQRAHHYHDCITAIFYMGVKVPGIAAILYLFSRIIIMSTNERSLRSLNHNINEIQNESIALFFFLVNNHKIAATLWKFFIHVINLSL